MTRPTHRRRPLRRLAATLGLTALLAAPLASAPLAAEAATNDRIVVGDAALSADGDLAVGTAMTFSGTWDATAADPQPGDGFTITLPAELGFPEALPLTMRGEDGTDWGSCLTDPASRSVACELSDAVVERPEQVRGAFAFSVTARAVTAERELVFDLNGDDVAVALPGEQGIGDGVVLPGEWSKRGSLNGDKKSVTWTIDLPGSRLAGSAGVRILEQLSGPHELCEPAGLRVQTVRGGAVTDVSALATIVDPAREPYGFAIDLAAPEGGFDETVLYRVSYTTCSSDGLIAPKGTVYGNEATVEQWGESSGVIGVEQGWTPGGEVVKTGRVLGGDQRNGRIEWLVTIAGDHLAGRDTVRIGERLSGAHELCVDESGRPAVADLRIEQRYGPGTNAVTRLDEGTVAREVSGASATGFDLALRVVDPGFAFQASPYLYTLRYTTCATEDGLPAAGEQFANTVSVEGVVDEAVATVPGRSEGKNGRINTAPVTVGGEERAAQTTLGWTVTVPGERLAAIDGPIEVRDTLSANQVVCGSGDVADRLNLRVEARDQINGGGLATVDLGDLVTATVEGQEIVLSIAQPSLPLPGGGTSDGFVGDYQLVIDYTTCTASGALDEPGTAYGNEVEVAGSTWTRSVEQRNSASITGEGVARGSVSVVKQVAGEAAALVPEGTEFTVHVVEIDPSGAAQAEYDLAVPLGGDPVAGLNARGGGWTIELSEPTLPDVPGVLFGDPSFAETPGVQVLDDGRRAVATVTPATNVVVELTNTALPLPELPTLPLDEQPGQPEAPTVGGLAITGAELAPMLLLAGLAIALGTTAVVLRRRRA